MNNFLKTLAFYLCMSSHTLYATLSNDSPALQRQYTYEQKQELIVRGYCSHHSRTIPYDIFLCIASYRYKKNPNKIFAGNDIVGEDLRDCDLTGYEFSNPNLTDTMLDGAILTNTICKYQLSTLPLNNHINKATAQLLTDISKRIYPTLKEDADKATLLPIASGLYYSKEYQKQNVKYTISTLYWYTWLIHFLDYVEIEITTKNIFDEFIELGLKVCWTRENYTTTYIDDKKLPHKAIGQYLKEFNDQVKSGDLEMPIIISSNGITEIQRPIENNYYVQAIQKCFEGLKKTYELIDDEKLQSAIASIAYGLSKLPYLKGNDQLFLRRYLHYQYSLVKLQEKLPEKAQHAIYYKGIPEDFFTLMSYY